MPESVAAIGAFYTSGTAASAAAITATGAVAGAVVSSALAPKPGDVQAPKLPGAIPLPDPLAQQMARQKSIAEQLARGGRASTILTDQSVDKLGG